MLASQLGYYSLILGLIFSFILIFFATKELTSPSKRVDQNIIILSFLQLTFVVVSFLCLIFSFVNSDFSNETVFNNSHTAKPLFYKISGTIRASFAFYNTKEEIDIFIAAINKAKMMLS